jgi:hypothetical protein
MIFNELTVRGISRYLHDADLGEKDLRLHISQVEAGKRSHPPHQHGGFEGFYILEGQGTVEIEDEEFILRANETAVFAAQYSADVPAKLPTELPTNETTFDTANCAALLQAVESAQLRAVGPAFETTYFSADMPTYSSAEFSSINAAVLAAKCAAQFETKRTAQLAAELAT